VTPWSNELDVYNPPVQPVIYTDASSAGAYYDPSGADTLYVLLNPDASNNPYDYNVMKFVVCYFFQDASGATVWSVSDPLGTTTSTFGTQTFRLITVPNIGTVSTTSPYNKVYVSIHAVYDWVDSSNNYYAVSYMSNEVVAVEASSDAQPDITAVDYNVYTSTLAVPGDQTMTVTWTAPGNSVLPFYAVAYYNLYYSTDSGTTFTLYDGSLNSMTLDYTVDVGTTGSNPLNLDCGDSIEFRVDAVTVNGAVEQSNISSSTNIFKYSEAVTNLQAIFTSYDPSSIDMTVTFNGVSDAGTPNKGCGAGQQYVVLINGVVYSATAGSLAYVSGASYSILYTGLPVTQTGTVEVYLETNNTNASPASPLAGLSATAPYIANDVVLSPVVYEVYSYGNLDQDMVLTWTDPTVSPWSVVDYNVQYSIDGSTWNDASGGTGLNTTSYTFDATSFAISVTLLQFRVLANMTTGSVNYTITSNVESKNTFQYSLAPATALLNWAVADPSATTMDINVTFTNPTFEGVNNGLQYFNVTVYDSSTVPQVIASVDVSYNTAPVYDTLSGIYTVNFNDITYSFTGTVVIAPYVTDTNGAGDITFDAFGYKSTLSYNTDSIPIFLNIVSNGSTTPTSYDATITGNIVTHDVLKPFGCANYIDGSGNPAVITITDLGGGVPGVTLTYIIQSNGEYYYTFSINVYTFFTPGTVPSSIILNVANNAGVSENGIVNPFNA
jgi:hypothetical protein